MKYKKIVFRLLLLLGLMVWLPLKGMAQTYRVMGIVINGVSLEPIVNSWVSVLDKEGKVVCRSRTNEKGFFVIEGVKADAYRLQCSMPGYKTYKNLMTKWSEEKREEVDTIRLEETVQLLAEAEVVAQVAQVVTKGDTTQFNAAAFNTPPNAKLEMLIKQLPGVQVEDDGSITLNGQKIKELLVNGKDFFKGKDKVAMKQLPSDIVKYVKAYNKRSDYAEDTGIEDVEDYPVLDITTKREINQTIICNVDVGRGNHDRYNHNLNVMRYTDRSSIMAYGTINNMGGRSYADGFKGNSKGLTTEKEGGFNASLRNAKTRKEAGFLSGNVNFMYESTHRDLQTEGTNESFYSSARSSFGKRKGVTLSENQRFRLQGRLQWRMDSLTMLTFVPSLSHRRGEGEGSAMSVTLRSSPDSLFEGAASDEWWNLFEGDNLPERWRKNVVNRNKGENVTSGRKTEGSMQVNVVRRLNRKGRNVSLQTKGMWNKEENERYSVSLTNFFGGEDVRRNFRNQYSMSPGEQEVYLMRWGYVEPLVKHLYWQSNYQYKYSRRKNDRMLYRLNRLDAATWGNAEDYPPMGMLPEEEDSLLIALDKQNSRKNAYSNYLHTGNTSLKFSNKKWMATAGVEYKHLRTTLAYHLPGSFADTMIYRRVHHFSPSVQLRYSPKKRMYVKLNYSATERQVPITQMMDVMDNSNPLRITMGNTGLQPGWYNSLRLSVESFNGKKRRGGRLSYEMVAVSHEISNRTIYDASTGVRYMRPENIKGVWNMRLNGFGYLSLGEKKRLSLSGSVYGRVRRNVSFVSEMPRRGEGRPQGKAKALSREEVDALFDATPTKENVGYGFNCGQRVKLRYRKGLFDFSVYGRYNYQHTKNSLRAAWDKSTWQFSYGGKTTWNALWGTSVTTELRMMSRRGFANAAMNTNECVWNFKLGQTLSFISKGLHFSLECIDVLRQRTEVSRVVNQTMRSENWTNGINAYWMAHVSYNLNIFPSKKKGGREREAKEQLYKRQYYEHKYRSKRR